MAYSLFVDFSLLEAIRRMSPSQRSRFENHLARIRDYPANYATHSRYDPSGRLLHVSLFEDMAIYYWIDDADRHVKVMSIAKRIRPQM